MNSHKIFAAAVGITCGALALRAQSGNELASCAATPAPPFCRAVRGDRAGRLARRRAVRKSWRRTAWSSPASRSPRRRVCRILQQGGNAIDAAVATAARPQRRRTDDGRRRRRSVRHHLRRERERKLYALNASGTAPTRRDDRALRRARLSRRSRRTGDRGPACRPAAFCRSPFPAPSGAGMRCSSASARARSRKCSRPRSTTRRTDSRSPSASPSDWTLPRRCRCAAAARERDPDSVKTWYINGRPPVAGQRFRNPDLARTFKLLQQQGADVFYKGEIAQRDRREVDGARRHDDARRSGGYKGQWVEPASSRYHGVDVFELPPPSQAWATNEMLNILEACVPKWAPGQTLASLGPTSPQYWHLLVEAKKLAYADLYRYNADPDVVARAARAAPVEAVRRVAVQQGRIPTSIRHGSVGPRATATATRSCCRPATARATWCRG